MSRNSSYFQENASASSQHYCLRWNNYQTNMTSVFHQLLQNESFVDVTLACNDVSLKAHKVVLSACSSYFQKLLMENPCNHPTIIMPPDICFEDLKFIIEFVYRGEIDVSQEELQSLLRTADQLKIKGLCDVSGEKEADTYPFYDDSPTLLKKTTQSKICRLTPTKRPYARETGLNKRLFSSEQRNFSNKDFTGSSSSNRTEFISGDTDGGHQNHHNKTLKSEQTADCGESGGGEEDGVNMPVVTQQLQEAAVANQRADAWSPAPPDASDAHGTLIATQTLFPGHVELPPEPPAPAATPVPCSPQELMQTGGHLDPCSPATHHDLSESNMSTGSCGALDGGDVKVKFETLRSIDSLDACSSHSGESSVADLSASASMHTTMMITPELLGLIPSETDMTEDPMGLNGMKSSSNGHNSHGGHHSVHVGNGGSSSHSGSGHNSGPKTWSQEDMELALDALRNHNMSLTKASATYGIPSTTLWQRAHRLGIDTPKKEGPTKSWTEENLNSALEALRTGTISANKASKAYGIPSSTLYKIARREGIRLAAPFNAAPTTWSPEDLEKALESIRSGQTSVQRASTEFGIPTGTLYGRCKREGIELSRSNPTPWSEDAMGEALEAVRVGHMSINQAAIHYNLPYSSLYGRFKRGKYETEPPNSSNDHSNDQSSTSNIPEQQMMYSSSSNQGQSSQQSAHNMASVHNMVATTSQYQHQNIS